MAKKKKTKLKDYHFDVGNSSTGHVGMCAVVRAESPEEAVDILTSSLPEDVPVQSDNPAIQYINVYLNPAPITVKDIDFSDDVEEES